ncbi:vWA domain-containing protein [Olivibacter domesticus]|uniref:VWFA domain-containing protein n=1 Tax=Olivibacter domesticus TaxID=407022 RepID=A0A1H7UDD4_OLID1|nr:hypothetical protein [Olivibacter domesticus]SEL94705.1 hypothetical protein SAMN05661044_03832 [Olivibacter domesticus]
MSDNTKKVDLVIVIDTSGSMKDEAQALSAAISAAVEQAKSDCPSDLRVDYLGIEGTFENTKFDETVRSYLTQKVGVDAASLKSRVRKSLANAGANEDGARAVEDVSEHYDWREGAERSIFLLQDESLDAGDMVVTPAGIKANNNAIATAIKNEVKVHTYLGTPDASLKYPTKQDEENMIKEFKRLALRTGGDHNIYINGLPDFKKVLKDTICASKIPQEVSIDDKKDEADDLEDKPTDKPKEETSTDKPTGGKLTCTDLCDQLPEIAKAINTLTTFLKNFEEVCKNAKEHDEDCKCKDKKPANETTTPATPKPVDPKPTEKPTENKPAPDKPVENKPTPEKPVAEKPVGEKPAPPATPTYSEIDQIYAITYYDGAFPGNQADNGDIYVHNGGNGERIRKAIDNQHGAGWSNATTSDGTHYFGWQANQIYRRKEGQNFEYLRGLSGGKGKDAFAFRKDDTGFFFSAIEGGKIYTFKHPQTNYSTVQVKGAAGNPHQPFGNGTGIIDIAFDGDDRAYLLDSSGRAWRVDNTQGTDWEAKYLCQFASAGEAGEKCSYFGLAFDSHGGVYLAGGIKGSGGAKRFIAKSNFSSPEKVEKIYDGGWGSASYGNLSSRAYPKIA